MTILETPRLLIRCLEPGDAPFILELLNEPGFIRNIADKGVRDLEGARAYIENGPMASYAKHGFGLWRVALKEGDLPVGICGLIKREGLEDVDLGYALLERFWSRGYAVEAAAACLDHGFRSVGLKRIVAITAPHNEASCRVLERIGMTFEGLIELPQCGGANRLYRLEFR